MELRKRVLLNQKIKNLEDSYNKAYKEKDYFKAYNIFHVLYQLTGQGDFKDGKDFGNEPK